MLTYLERHNLFLLPLDTQRQWYRYHHLFAQLLRAQLPRTMGTASAALLSTRASHWYEQQGWLAEAIEAALAASDLMRAGALIRAHRPRNALPL